MNIFFIIWIVLILVLFLVWLILSLFPRKSKEIAGPVPNQEIFDHLFINKR